MEVEGGVMDHCELGVAGPVVAVAVVGVRVVLGDREGCGSCGVSGDLSCYQ